ncbi:UNVERIFIED_CONTAM: hypothetical protein Cloal_4282 [Acetivibrio alkalicellulosi]
MIKRLLFYNFRFYSRSHKFIVPLMIYLAMFAILYSTKPLEVMNTYGTTAMFIFIIAVVITYSFMEIEDPVQQQLSILSLRNDNKYYFCKVLFIWIIISLMSVIIVLYPMIFGFFNRSVTLSDFFAALLGNIVLGLLGVCVSVLFNSRLFQSRRFATIALITVILFSVIQKAIIIKYPSVRWGLYILPPVSFVVDKMSNFEDVAGISVLFLAFASSLVYSSILLALYIKLMKVKMF